MADERSAPGWVAPRPAMVMRGARRVRITLTILGSVFVIATLGLIGWLAVEVAASGSGTSEQHGVAVPVWVVAGGGALATAVGAWDAWASRRLLARGLLEVLDDGLGLRLRRHRRFGRPDELYVRPGEMLHISAWTEGRRYSPLTPEQHTFTVVAPGGRMRFVTTVFIDRLSMVPLDEAADRRGVTILVHGDASVIERSPKV